MRCDRFSGLYFSIILCLSLWLFPCLLWAQLSAQPSVVPAATAPVLSEQEQRDILGFANDTSSKKAADFSEVVSVAEPQSQVEPVVATSGNYQPPTGTQRLQEAAETENAVIGKPGKISPAAISEEQSQQATKTEVKAKPGIWRSLFSLIAVLAVIVALTWLMRKLFPGRVSLTLGRTVQVVGLTPIGARQNLTLVRFGSDLLLLGVSGENIQLLDKVTDPDKIAVLMGAIESERLSSISRSFAGVLGKARQEYELGDDLEDEGVIEEFQEDGAVVTTEADRELGGLLARVKSLSKIKNKREK
ncbi:MAG: FliO/MopB family protein [Sedimentisphaerales bacterium]|nr:FliO/MopB family protein [Sedimentisphaerales bacterium]MBN2843620.1 FliO/MopB family protein [Sedimentisphaerales bacterium]